MGPSLLVGCLYKLLVVSVGLEHGILEVAVAGSCWLAAYTRTGCSLAGLPLPGDCRQFVVCWLLFAV